MKLHIITYITIFSFCLLNNNTLFSQETKEKVNTATTEKEEKKKSTPLKKKKKRLRPLPKKKKQPKRKTRKEPFKREVDPDFYSVFTDFRIPARENINETDLRYDGWKTDEGRYTFRCKDNKRVRLTFWYFDKKIQNFKGSEFINITPAIDSKCTDKDILYDGAPTITKAAITPTKKDKEIVVKKLKKKKKETKIIPNSKRLKK